MSNRFDPITGQVVPVFFHYAVPSVLGILAATSAGVIDGMFIGHFVGASALAAVNIAMPAFYVFAAVVFMLAVGGSVMCGKFLGERNRAAASSIFSKTVYAATSISLTIVAVSLIFVDPVVTLLGANEELHPMVRDYMVIILWASPLFIVGLTLDYFVRIDGAPLLASAALILYAVSNIALDWLFIVHFQWGIKGAALATALAEGAILLTLITHFFRPRCNLRLVAVRDRWRDGWELIFKAAYNGFSEFATEMSLAVVTLLFNWVMITRMGVNGVAAFTIISYLLMIGLQICYGISESLQPAVSKNLGAGQPDRIARFLALGVSSVFVVGMLLSLMFIFFPHLLIAIFLREGETATETIALAFIAAFWPAFLFNGVNITLGSYFTALHKPVQSAVIAISRSLVFPALGVLLLPVWLGDLGIFLSIPVAEAITLVIALALVFRFRPSHLIPAAGEQPLTEP
jgi:putative MATE family efflux protein